MTQAPVSFRFRAVSMGFAAYLDAPTLANVSLSFVRATPFSPFKSTSEKCATLVPGSRPGAGTTASRWERALRPSGRRASLEHQPIRRSKPIRVSFKTTIAVLGLALCVPLAACAPTRTRESTGAYIDDASITTKVKAAILADGGLKASISMWSPRKTSCC